MWQRESGTYSELQAGLRVRGIVVGRHYFGRWPKKHFRWSVRRSCWLWGVRATDRPEFSSLSWALLFEAVPFFLDSCGLGMALLNQASAVPYFHTTAWVFFRVPIPGQVAVWSLARRCNRSTDR